MLMNEIICCVRVCGFATTVACRFADAVFPEQKSRDHNRLSRLCALLSWIAVCAASGHRDSQRAR